MNPGVGPCGGRARRDVTQELRLQQKEKVRIFALARELHMESKDLVSLCRQHGIDVKNQLSTIEPEQRDQILQLVRKKAAAPATPTQTPAVKPPAVLDTRVRDLC